VGSTGPTAVRRSHVAKAGESVTTTSESDGELREKPALELLLFTKITVASMKVEEPMPAMSIVASVEALS